MYTTYIIIALSTVLTSSLTQVESNTCVHNIDFYVIENLPHGGKYF